ncbi:hypothetical protein Bbelb_006880 [Branchiostoma belcheri]|nr:hypothetical protein Bbelb_006880 [Branchiostoma belcheri]
MDVSNQTNTTPAPAMPFYVHGPVVTGLYIVGYCLVFSLNVVGNAVVCWVIASTPRLHTATNYFILNLAVADLLVAVFCIPFTLQQQRLSFRNRGSNTLRCSGLLMTRQHFAKPRHFSSLPNRLRVCLTPSDSSLVTLLPEEAAGFFRQPVEVAGQPVEVAGEPVEAAEAAGEPFAKPAADAA